MNAPAVLRPGTEGDHLARTILAALPPGERREAYALARWFLRALAALSVVCGACGPRGCVTRHAGAREARDAVDALCSIAHTAAAAVTGSPHRGAVNALLCATIGADANTLAGEYAYLDAAEQRASYQHAARILRASLAGLTPPRREGP